MKKTFKLKASNKAPARQVEAVKHEIKKYMAREKRKALPEGFDFWDFDCQIGESETSELSSIFVNEIRPFIDKMVLEKNESFYIELLSKPVKFTKKKV